MDTNDNFFIRQFAPYMVLLFIATGVFSKVKSQSVSSEEQRIAKANIQATEVYEQVVAKADAQNALIVKILAQAEDLELQAKAVYEQAKVAYDQTQATYFKTQAAYIKAIEKATDQQDLINKTVEQATEVYEQAIKPN